jgi:CHAT domain-containing protein
MADNLPHLDRELEILAGHAKGTAQTWNPCRREDWPGTGNYRIWHYAGHARLRSDNPFYSSLMLHDGPLFAVDFRLKSCRVNLVTLASCRSGELLAMPGEEATGLVRSLLEMGARNVVAGHWSVSDKVTAMWMGAFYERVFNGEDICGSVRHAARTVRQVHPSAYYWAAFSTFGAGD